MPGPRNSPSLGAAAAQLRHKAERRRATPGATVPRKAPKREPLDAVVGLIAGAIWGATVGLGVCIWLLPRAILFPGDTMAVGAVIFGVLGYYRGSDVFRWLRDHW